MSPTNRRRSHRRTCPRAGHADGPGLAPTAPSDTLNNGAAKIGHSEFEALLERAQEALGELVRRREGRTAGVGVGLGVLAKLIAERSVTWSAPRADTTPIARLSGMAAGRTGHTLGGSRVPVKHPRVRAADGSGEVEMTPTGASPTAIRRSPRW